FTVRQAFPGERGLRQYWEPSYKCKGFKLPHIAMLIRNPLNLHQHYIECMQYLQSRCRNTNPNTIGFFCRNSRPDGISFKDLERKDMDFKEFLNQITPSFISLSARDDYNGNITQIIMAEGNFTQNPNDVFTNITQNLYQIRPFKRHGLDEALIRILKNLLPVEFINYAAGQVHSNRCGNP
ncbi:unnamed protein product, partial [Allacma fusca]